MILIRVCSIVIAISTNGLSFLP